MSYNWIVTLLLLTSLRMGHAAYYAPDVMERVIAVRQAGWTASSLPVEAPQGVECFVAVRSCDDVGDVVLVWHQNGGWERCWITDCCCRLSGDCDRMKRRNILVEWDFQTAKRRGVIGQGPMDIVVVVTEAR